MKKFFLLAALLTSLISFSQDSYKPAIKKGSKLKYLAHVDGQDIPMLLSFDSISTTYLKLGWEIDGYGAGSWVMSAKSLESSTSGYWGNPSGTKIWVLNDPAMPLLLKIEGNTKGPDLVVSEAL